MGCQIGRIIIENNEGTVIFGNVGTINITQTTVSSGGSGTSSDSGSSGGESTTRNGANGSDTSMDNGGAAPSKRPNGNKNKKR